MRQAVRVGKLVAVPHAGGDGVAGMVDRLAARGFRIRRTPHFVHCQRRPGGQVVLVHPFSESTIDEDVSQMIGEELGSLGVVRSAGEYGELLLAVVASTCPSSLDCPDCGRLHLDRPAVWRHFSLNTLGRLRTAISAPGPDAGSRTAAFAAIYRRILERRVGDSLLDVGSNLGHLPVLLAEVAPDVRVVGCDSRREAVACGEELAAAAGGARVTFRLADVLAPDFAAIGRYDTVTAVHVLEHLARDEMPVALTHLLDATARRLVVSVPYEDAPQPLYGHRQAFTPEELRSWGEWCVERLGARRFACEDVSGGFLVVDRS